LIQPAPAEQPIPVVPPLEDPPQPNEAASVTPPELAPPIPQLHVEGSLARFLPQWRIRR
jgi:hypothetical protein